MGQIQGKLVLFRVSGEIRLTEGSSHRGSTVIRRFHPIFTAKHIGVQTYASEFSY